MTLLVHFLQYRLHLSEMTDTNNQNNGRYRLITEPIIGTSLLQNNYSKYTTRYLILMHVVFTESIT